MSNTRTEHSDVQRRFEEEIHQRMKHERGSKSKKNQHHHQHHHHHRHHLNHFALCVYATNVRVCNNSYILRNTHADFINGKKSYVCCFSSFFARNNVFKASMPFKRNKCYAGKQCNFEKYVSSLLLFYY